ncbi:exo-alpha-sialidase [Trypanosoma cruzi]|nr:exo-alpha-sialidase [Trypanosoma cruzi]
MRKHIRRACVHRSQMNPVQIPSKSNSPFLKPFLHSIRPDPHPHVLTHTNRHRQMVAAQRSGKTCPARTRITNDMRQRTEQRRRSAHRKDAALHSSRSPPRASHPQERMTRGARSLSPPSLHAHGRSSSHPQPPAHATKEASKSTAMCILCVHVVVCACRHTKQRSKNRSRACEGTHKQNYSRSAWQK